MESLTRRPALDGLRGIAILLVLGYHGFGEFVTGGWLGVDVFFVLSGFLMGLLLLPQMDAGALAVRDFVVRRARRLLPALVVVVTAVSGLSWLLQSDEAFRQFSASALSSLGIVSNVFFWQNSGYFETPLDENPLLHLWSVSIEGQFYLVLVLFLLLTVRLGWKSAKPLLWIAALISLSLSLSGLLDSDATFFLLPTRMWEFLAGVLLAETLRRKADTQLSGRIAAALGIAGGLVILGWGIFADSSTYSTLSSVAVTLGTVAAIVGAHYSPGVARVLSTRVLIGLGLVSYSLYLWHWPLLVLSREVFVDFGPGPTVAVLVASLGLSALTWRYIEQPFRRRSLSVSRSPYSWSLVATALLSAGLVLGTTGIVGASGLRFQTINVPGYFVGEDRAQEDRWELIRENGGGIGPDCGDGDDDHEGWIDPAGSRPGLVVIGNSHARDLYNVLAQSDELSAQYQIGKMSCQLSDMLFHPGFLESQTYRDAEFIVISSRYSDIDVAALPDVVQRLQSDGKTIALTMPFPEITLETREEWMWIDPLVFDHPEAWKDPETLSTLVNHDAYSVLTEADRPFAADVQGVADEYGIPLLDRLDYVCDVETQQCVVLSPSMQKHFYDESHHSLSGADYFAERVDAVDWLAPLHR